MVFKTAHVRSVKADLASGSISITLSVPMEDLSQAEDLANYAGKDASDMKVDITPRQPALFATKPEQS